MKNEYETYEQISVVVPCYNEESALPYFYTEIRKAADSLYAAFRIFIPKYEKQQTACLLLINSVLKSCL